LSLVFTSYRIYIYIYIYIYITILLPIFNIKTSADKSIDNCVCVCGCEAREAVPPQKIGRENNLYYRNQATPILKKCDIKVYK